jgi:hypothetical protein
MTNDTPRLYLHTLYLTFKNFSLYTSKKLIALLLEIVLLPILLPIALVLLAAGNLIFDLVTKPSFKAKDFIQYFNPQYLLGLLILPSTRMHFLWDKMPLENTDKYKRYYIEDRLDTLEIVPETQENILPTERKYIIYFCGNGESYQATLADKNRREFLPS